MATREWHLVEGQQHLGVFSEPALNAMARQGKLSNSVLLSCGGGWITVPQFLAQQGENGILANAATAPVPPPHMSGGNGNGYAAPPSMPQPDSATSTTPQDPVRAPMMIEAPPIFSRPPMARGDFLWQQPAEPMAAPPMAPPQFADEPRMEAAPMPARPTPIEPIDEGPPERDRIVVLGRRQSGKTIYLASVYQKLWRNLQGLTAKALRGEVHKQLMDVSHVLKQGQWPAATLGSAHMELELEEAGHKRLMVALDYAGEMFANAFVHERLDLPDVKTLVDHIDRAAAVMLLIDPSIVAGMDHQAAVEDDFGLVQAVQRIRNWPGGDDVPIVLVLTKIDQHQRLLDQFGGPDGFCRHHFPALVRLLRKVAIFQVSAVQVEKGEDGKLLPRKDSTGMNVENPLRYCLRQILRAEEKSVTDRTIQERRMLESRLQQEERSREKRQNLVLIIAISAIILAGVVIILLIVL